MSVLISDLSISQDFTVTAWRRVGMGAIRRDAHRLDQKVMDTEVDEGKIMKRYGKHGIGKKIMAPQHSPSSLHLHVSPGETHAWLFSPDLRDVRPKMRLKWNTVNPGRDGELN